MRFREDDAIIDIPEPYRNITNYRATLGHKINHSFKFRNANFHPAYHPRFGNIGCAYAVSNIPKGEEILVDYQYHPEAAVPEWYSEVYLEETGETWSSFVSRYRKLDMKLL